MINFIYGLPGTGKTTEITNRIKNDIALGKQAMLIVPEQQTVEAERSMLLTLPASAQLSFEVLNFTRLANKLFRIYGGLCYNYITSGMKSLFMKRTLIELAPMLVEYNLRAVGDSSLPALMLSQINEFKINGIKAHQLERAANSLDDKSQLKAKLNDLSLIYSSYSGAVESSYDDVTDDLEKLYKLLCTNNFFNGYNVYIDSFSSFTAWEYKIIERIFAQADNCTITIPSNAPTTGAIHLHSVNKTSKKLMELTDKDSRGTMLLSEPHRASTPALKRLWEHLWDFSVNTSQLPKIEDDESVKIIECADMYSEAESAANTVLSLLHKGYRYNEIAIVAGNMDSYRGIIDTALEKAGVPFFMSEKTDLITQPLISFIMSAFAIKLRNWRTEDVIGYLKTGLSDISPADIDLFELYISAWKISGNRFFDEIWTMNPDGYYERISPRGMKIRDTANEVKNRLVPSLSAFFSALDAAKNVAELCQATFDFFKTQELSEKLLARSRDAYRKNDKKSALEIAGTHKAFIKVLGDISSVLGEEEMSLEEFCSSLKAVLGNTDIGTIPTAADEVILGSASMLRASNIKCAVLMGMCDGKFPAHISENGFFSDNEKQKLSELGIELSSNTKEGSAEELLYAYRAVTMPSDKLIMTYHTKSGNAPQKPSLAITRACALLHIEKPICYERTGELDRLMSKALAFESYRSLKNKDCSAALKEIFKDNPEFCGALNRIDIPISDTACKLSPDTASALFGNRLSLTQSKIDQYVKCHFNYFCNYILGLRDNATASFGYADTGTFIHRLLEVFIRYTVDENGLNRSISQAELEEVIRKEAKLYIDRIFSSRTTPSRRQLHLFERLTKLAVVVASSLYNELLLSSFVPKYLEMRFGNRNSDILPAFELTLNDKSKITLEGTVDRLDIFKKNDTVYIKVVDYKTGTKTFSLDEVEQGLNIQLLLYMFAICNTASEKFRKAIGCNEGDSIKPAGIIYVSTALGTIDADLNTTTEEIIEKAKSNIPRAGLVTDDEDILLELCHDLNTKYLPGVSQLKDGTIKGKSLTDDESFAHLEESITNTLVQIATSMRGGNANISPLKLGDKYPCEYCKMKQFCRVDLKAEEKSDEEEE